MKHRVHCIPVGQVEPPHHASPQCWCHPTEKDGGGIVVHNAKDCREKWERQGITDPEKPWCTVYEDLPAYIPPAS